MKTTTTHITNAGAFSARLAWTCLVSLILVTKPDAQAATANELVPVNVFTHGQGLFYGSTLTKALHAQDNQPWQDVIEDGYRPVSVNAYMPTGSPSNSDVEFATAWVWDDDCAFPSVVLPNATPQTLENGVASLEGYRPISITGHLLSPFEARLTVAMLRDDSDVDWMYILNKTGVEYQAAAENAAALGYRALSVSGYSYLGTDIRFSAIYVRDGLPKKDWATHHGIRESEYQEYIETWVDAGFWPISLSAYPVGNETHFTTVMTRHTETGARWAARHGLTSAELSAENDLWTSENNVHGRVLRPITVAAYRSGGTLGPKRFAAVWRSSSKRRFIQTGTEQPSLAALDDAMEVLMKGKDVNAASLTVARHGQVKLSRGYTWAPPEFPITLPNARFRIASASKAVTAVAVMKMLEDPIITGMKGGGLQALTLDTPVFQINGMPDLPAAYGASAQQMTIRDLLRHRAGWDRNVWEPLYSDTTVAGALSVSLPLSRQDMIEYMTSPALWPTPNDPSSIGYVNNPGSAWTYSNFGFSLLAELIEVIKDQPYEDYVRRNVLVPVGAHDTFLGRTARLLKRTDPDEVIYTAGGSTNPRWYVSDSNYDPMNAGNPTTASRVDDAEPGSLFPTTSYGRFNIHTIDAAGGWVSTTPDMVKLLRSFDPYDANMAGSDTPLLDWSSMWEMWDRPENISPNVSIGGDYVLGWQRDSVCSAAGTNVTIWHHGGAVDGAMSLIAHRADGISFAATFSRLRWGNGFTQLNEAICAITDWPLDILAPVFTDIPDQSIPPGTPIPPITFGIEDDETPADKIRLTAHSSNPTFLPSHDIILGGSDKTRTLTLYPIGGLAGQTTVTLTATDEDGNEGTEAFVLTIEGPNNPPTLDRIADVHATGCPRPATVVLTGISDGDSAKIIGTVVILATSDSSQIPHPTVDYTPGSDTATLHLPAPRTPSGSARITVTVDDGAPNNHLLSRVFEYSWAVDATPPKLICPDDIVVWACDTNPVPVFFDPPIFMENSAGRVTVTCFPESGSLFESGTDTEVECRVVDACGNERRCTFVVSVRRDLTPPVIECPTNIVVKADSARGTRVEFDVRAQDDQSGTVPVECIPASGSMFPVGTTVVTCHTQDDCGNLNTCSFEITVRGPTLELKRPAGSMGLELFWKAEDAVLEKAEDLGGPWRRVPEARSPFLVEMADLKSFFRLAPTFKYGGQTFSMDLFEQNIRDYLIGQCTGFTYVLSRNGQKDRHGAWGVARTETDGPELDMTHTKRINVASVSKTITATAVLNLLEDMDDVDINSSVAPYLPHDWVLGPGVAELTFKDLLTHKSGLAGASSNYDTLRGYIEQGLGPKSYKYQNSNFALFRIIIPHLWNVAPWAPNSTPEEITALVYEAYVQEFILEPMGILDAWNKPTDENPMLLYRFPYDGLAGKDPGDFTFSAGAFGWNLSAQNLAAFLAHLRFGDILEDETKALMDQHKLGWSASSTKVGDHGTYYAHGGDLKYNPQPQRGVRTCIMDFPNGVQAALIINSRGGNHPYQATLLKEAFDDAWE